MAKTLDQIINRQDYIKLNAALKNRAISVARKAHEKMDSLDLEEIEINGSLYRINRYTSNISYEEHLTVVKEYGYDDWAVSLEQDYSEYLHGDLSCRLECASSSDFLCFLNNARALFDKLDEIETEKCKAIEQALESTKKI